MGWSRKGRKGGFRYYDSSDKRITFSIPAFALVSPNEQRC